MKRIATLALAAICAISAAALDTRWVEIKSTNDVAALKAIPEWKRGVDTNGVTITVCVGAAVVLMSPRPLKYPLSRDLEFDAEGRLVRVSSVSIMAGMSDRALPCDTSLDRLILDLDREKEYNARRLEIERNRSPEEKARIEEAIQNRRLRRYPTRNTMQH